MKQLPIRPFRQETLYSCCAAILQVIVDYFNQYISHSHAIKLVKCNKRTGAYLKDVAKTAKKLCKVRHKTLYSPRSIEKYIDKHGLIIAADDLTYTHNHAILIVGYDKNYWSVYDPNTGKILLKNKNLVFKHSDEFIAVYK